MYACPQMYKHPLLGSCFVILLTTQGGTCRFANTCDPLMALHFVASLAHILPVSPIPFLFTTYIQARFCLCAAHTPNPLSPSSLLSFYGPHLPIVSYSTLHLSPAILLLPLSLPFSSPPHPQMSSVYSEVLDKLSAEQAPSGVMV